MKRLTSLILSLFMVLSSVSTAFAGTAETATTRGLLDSSTVWYYLDNNTDPAANSATDGYDRTSWTFEDYSVEGWKTGVSPFGSKRGGANYSSTLTAKTVLDGCDGSNNTPTYFFRTAFTIDSLEGYTCLKGALDYDDGAIVYINGQRVGAGSDIACDENGNQLGHGFDENLQFGGSNQGPDLLEFVVSDLKLLHEGTNTIAVEIHNGRKTSSDVWFNMVSLELSDEPVKEEIYQSNVCLNVGEDSGKTNVTWYSQYNEPSVLLSVNSDMTDSRAFSAKESLANDGQYSCKATLTDLVPNTTYYYQLCNGDKISSVRSFTTGGGDEFSFALVGDPQIGAGSLGSDIEGWDNTLNIIRDNEVFRDAAFLVSAGDQVNTASNETQYDGYLEHDALSSIITAPVVGNHDSGSNAYNQHFNLPNESASYGVTAAGGDYYFVYNNVLFMMLNSNAQSEQDVQGHKAFMEDAIAATSNLDIAWKIVVFHHTLFTVASHAHDSYIDSENGFKKLIIPVLQEFDVDVVLSGHDHVYCRTFIMDGADAITSYEGYEYSEGDTVAPVSVTNPEGILYVTANSGSGSKTYGILNETFPFSAVQNQENSANVSKVSVSGDSLSITTYRTSDMSVVDTFAIKRSKVPVKSNGIVKGTDDIYYYIVDGVIQETETGLVAVDGITYYVKNGVWQDSTTGLVTIGTKQYYIKKGIKSTGTGFVTVGTKQYYVKNGVRSTGTGFVTIGTKKYYVKKGVRSTGTGFATVGTKKYYVVRGVFQSAKTGFVTGKTRKYYVVRGVFQATKTGFVKIGTKKYYVARGVFQSAKTGLVKNAQGKYYYIKKGVWQSSFSGQITYNNHVYKIVNGIKVKRIR